MFTAICEMTQAVWVVAWAMLCQVGIKAWIMFMRAMMPLAITSIGSAIVVEGSGGIQDDEGVVE